MKRSLPLALRSSSRVFSMLVLAGFGTAGVHSQAAAQCGGGGSWSAPFEGLSGQPALDNTVTALGTWDPDGPGPLLRQLLVGGTFLNAGGVAVSKIALWNGTSWQALGTGVTSSGFPSTALEWDPDGSGPLLPQPTFGGFYTTVGGVTVRNITHWDGSSWQPFGAGTQDISGLPDVYASAMWDADGDGPGAAQLVIGGDFTVAGGASRKRIARWDGAAWQGFGTGMNDSVYTLTTWDPDGTGPDTPKLVAGGFFVLAGTTSAARIALWDGATWQAMGAGFDGIVEAVGTWDPDGSGPLPSRLIAAGSFTNSGTTPIRRIAMWDGSAWIPLGQGFDDNRVFTLASFDFDGTGPQSPSLVAAGSFSASGGSPLSRIARWDGATWQPVGGGMNSSIFELTTIDSDGDGPQPASLVAGGSFTLAGTVTASRIALFTAQPPACRADFNCQSGVTVQDIFDFLAAWFAGQPSADFNGVSGVTVQDIFDFLAAWFVGCD